MNHDEKVYEREGKMWIRWQRHCSDPRSKQNGWPKEHDVKHEPDHRGEQGGEGLTNTSVDAGGEILILAAHRPFTLIADMNQEKEQNGRHQGAHNETEKKILLPSHLFSFWTQLSSR